MRKKLLMVLFGVVVLALLILYLLYRPSKMTDEQSMPVPTFPSEKMEKMALNEPWKTFVAENFSILLPSLPQHVTEKVPLAATKDLITYDMYLVQQPVGSTFMISLIHYPPSFDVSNPSKVFESITKEMLSNNAESALVSSVQGQFLGKPSIDNVISNSSLYVYMKAFLVDRTLFVINVVDQQDSRAQEHFNKALASFQIVGG